MTEIWQNRATEILENKEEATKAAILYFLVMTHLRMCQHKRTCPEELLMIEVETILG